MLKILLMLLFFFPLKVNADYKKEVTLASCIDGDTAKFIYQGKTASYRFLAIDTKEINDKPFGPKAKEYTCQLLNKAKTITIEYDPKSEKQDKYKRELVWVFVDNELLQAKLIDEGLAEIKYIYGEYQYLDILKIKESNAKITKKGIWQENNDSYIIIILDYFNTILNQVISLLEKLKLIFT